MSVLRASFARTEQNAGRKWKIPETVAMLRLPAEFSRGQRAPPDRPHIAQRGRCQSLHCNGQAKAALDKAEQRLRQETLSDLRSAGSRNREFRRQKRTRNLFPGKSCQVFSVLIDTN
jgi:hypothetical protein